MYTEDELLPISALQHLEFCRRRCALIHIEGMWAENAQTAEGRILHDKVHEVGSETVAGVYVSRGLRLRSLTWGLFGVADLVEFHPLDNESNEQGAALPSRPGRWRPYPVEYKRGRRKTESSYLVQLCAQAICLEEILETSVPAGALYHGKSRRRQEVVFDASLREKTQGNICRLHELIAAGVTPPPEGGPKCRFCSLAGQCMPKLPPTRSARRYVSRMISQLLAETDHEETR